MSFVTTYFESCGDSLESVFVEKPHPKAARKSSRAKVSQRHATSLSDIVDPPGSCFHCGNVSKLSPLVVDESISGRSEEKTGIMELQRFDNSDLVFFPMPTSEVVAFYGKNDPCFRSLSTPSRAEVHNNSPVSIKTLRNPLAGITVNAEQPPHDNQLKQNSPRYQTGSPSPEVATKWIAMGASRNRMDDQKVKASRVRCHPWDQNPKLTDIPFDEETPSGPPKITPYQRYRKHQRPPPVPRRRAPLASTTNLAPNPDAGNSSSSMDRKDTQEKNDRVVSPSDGFIFNPNSNDFPKASSSKTALPPLMPQSFDEEEAAPYTPTKASDAKPGFFQRLQFAPKTYSRPNAAATDSRDSGDGCKRNCLLPHQYPHHSNAQLASRETTPYFPDNFTAEIHTGASVSVFIMPKEKNQSSDDAGEGEKKSHWKSAVDPRTGRTYYYHEITRETQWRKPMELATDEEKRAMEEKERKQKDFFAAMEANILTSISQGIVPGTPVMGGDANAVATTAFGRRMSSRKVSLGPDGRPPELVRTISTMDEDVLMDVIRRQPSFRNFKPGGVNREESLQSLQPNDLLGSRRRSSEVRDGFETWSQGSHSQNHPLETLEERFNESTDSLPALFNYLSDENGDIQSDEEGSLNESSLTGFGLTWEETQALKKLASITKEMIDAEKDVLMFEESPPERNNKPTFAGGTPAWKPPKDDKEKRDLPRELDFDESDEEDDDQETPKQLPALNKARQGSDGRALPREIDFSSDEEEESSHAPTSKETMVAKKLQKPGKSENGQSRPEVKRRNTCGTMYIGTTMSAPDKDATIRVRVMKQDIPLDWHFVNCGLISSCLYSSQTLCRFSCICSVCAVWSGRICCLLNTILDTIPKQMRIKYSTIKNLSEEDRSLSFLAQSRPKRMSRVWMKLLPFIATFSSRRKWRQTVSLCP
jgi:WW domain